MAKEKQVVKMAKVIEITEQIARDAHCGYPSPRMMASDLYDKGYRERSEVAREIIKYLSDFIEENEQVINTPNRCVWVVESDDLTDFIAELKKKYTEGET